jgi:hypothetical protein
LIEAQKGKVVIPREAMGRGIADGSIMYMTGTHDGYMLQRKKKKSKVASGQFVETILWVSVHREGGTWKRYSRIDRGPESLNVMSMMKEIKATHRETSNRYVWDTVV